MTWLTHPSFSKLSSKPLNGSMKTARQQQLRTLMNKRKNSRMSPIQSQANSTQEDLMVRPVNQRIVTMSCKKGSRRRAFSIYSESFKPRVALSSCKLKEMYACYRKSITQRWFHLIEKICIIKMQIKTRLNNGVYYFTRVVFESADLVCCLC